MKMGEEHLRKMNKLKENFRQARALYVEERLKEVERFREEVNHVRQWMNSK